MKFAKVGKTKLYLCNDGSYKADKLFLSPVKEELWLNSLARNGYMLVNRSVGGYFFTYNSNGPKFYFSITYSEVSSTRGQLSEETADMTNSMGEGAELLFTYGKKVYYKTLVARKNKDCDSTDCIAFCAGEKRRRMRNYFIASFSFLCTFLILLCYNLKYWVRFRIEDVGVTFVDGQLKDYIVKEHSLWDYTFDLSKLFGEYPCTPHISLFLTLTLLSIPFAVYYFDQYMFSRKFEKAVVKKCEKK